ncbi:Heterokaryon incompatibility protein 6,OR allele [Lachnellula subtilissima]|uniref:Heterokaryon incompatibility protein 6,OR allele n=1 Tax=Lachnellula subtilissima TaxID=602034 RepID=A0A8H8RQ14_9HELO|nr:Heterokaryon incompatibility protein 6,OR allele [Lachnellula subtilissima]
MAQYQGPPLLVYETLNSSNADIRLLTVYINEAADNLHYQLVACSLNDNFRPIYGALSYVWGDPRITVPITINGSVIQVTENLAKALTALSHIPETLDHLWVDALCINQSDVHEKSQQVSMMGRIYTEAKDVYAWLGPAISGSPLAMDFANQLAEDLREYGTGLEDRMAGAPPDYSLLCRPAYERFIGGSEGPKSMLECLAYLFADSTYWTRAWTFQELCLARGGYVFCGTDKIFIQDLHRVSTWYVYKIQQVHKGPSSVWDRKQAFVHLVRESKGAMAEAFSTRTYHSTKRRAAPEELKAAVLLSCLVVARRATDPRDKIFSILGLVDLDYPADYTAPLDKVYTGFTAQLLGEPHAFSLIVSMAGHLTQSPVVGGSLPSWVPDFDAVSKFDHNFMSGVKGYGAGDGVASDQNAVVPSFFVSSNCLLCRGIVVDEIVQVSIATLTTYAASPNATAEANDILDVLDSSFGNFSAGSFKNLVLQRAQHPMGISLLFAVVRTILFDIISNTLIRDLGMKSSILQTYVGCFLKYIFSRPVEAASEPNSETATMEDVLDLTDRVHLLYEDILGAIETEDTTVPQSTILRSLRKFALMSRFRTAGGYFGHAHMHVNRRGDLEAVRRRKVDHHTLSA